MLNTTPVYSPYFSCLYDEPKAFGYMGGAHYSVFRCAEWRDVVRAPLDDAQTHDFAVIWDIDHDTRIIEVIEKIYMAGLLSPIQFIGERKGVLTIIVAARFYFHDKEPVFKDYIRKLEAIAGQYFTQDSWPVEVGMFDRNPGSPHQMELHSLIGDSEHRVTTYVRHIDALWNLGTKPYCFEPSSTR